MLSKLAPSTSRILSSLRTQLFYNGQLKQNPIIKRWSGHNSMNIRPSTFGHSYLKNWLHFYLIVASVPIIVITSIVNIRANPVLSEVPDGYEPRHWEYFKHPITRWMAKYLYTPPELDEEVVMACRERDSEDIILNRMFRMVDDTMSFYNDHRSRHFRPFYADLFRKGRDKIAELKIQTGSYEGDTLERAYDPNYKEVPVIGIPPEDDSVEND